MVWWPGLQHYERLKGDCVAKNGSAYFFCSGATVSYPFTVLISTPAVAVAAPRWTSTLNQFVKMFSISPEQKGTRCSRARDHFSLSFMVSLLLWSSSRFCFSPNGNAQPVRPLTPSCFPKSSQK